MSEQNPFAAAPPPPAQQPYGTVPPQPGAPVSPGLEYGGFPPPPQRKSRRTLWIVLGCVCGVILLGAGLLGWFVYDAASTTGTRKVVLPETFQGLKQDPNNPVAARMQSAMQDALSQGKDAWNATPVAGLYTGDSGGPDADKAVIVFGGYGNVILPNTQVDAFYKSAGGEGVNITDRRDFDAGPLGGKLSCALMKAETETDSLCVWADGSSVIGVMTGKAESKDAPDLNQAAAAVREFRQVAEVKK